MPLPECGRVAYSPHTAPYRNPRRRHCQPGRGPTDQRGRYRHLRPDRRPSQRGVRTPGARGGRLL